MGNFIITKRKNGSYKFHLTGGYDQPTLTRNGFKTKSSCIDGISLVIKNSADMNNFERKTATNRKHYFTLKVPNGHIIGTSEKYYSLAARENGIYSVKLNAANAEIIDNE
ncbi:YegP family protein [Pedobacter gandavensis]|uniref:YegP family protein n=1 Tax=Pedobacter gandavensis TaxID=2679963 RepID=UPI0029311756|nr:YegP family protein [Pedobacter gandavensis]